MTRIVIPPHVAAAMDRLQLPNQDEMVPIAGPVEGEWWVDRITALEAHVARCEQIIHDQDAQLATPTPEPAPADPVADAARVLLDDLNIALGTKAPAQGREQWTYARKWANASDAAERAPTMMDRPTPIQMIRAALAKLKGGA